MAAEMKRVMRAISSRSWISRSARSLLSSIACIGSMKNDAPLFTEVEGGVAIERRRDIRHPRQRQQPLGQNEPHHLREVRLRRFAFRERAQRPAPRDAGLAERALRFHRDQREDAVELELLERDGVHAKLLDVRGWRAIPIGPA